MSSSSRGDSPSKIQGRPLPHSCVGRAARDRVNVWDEDIGVAEEGEALKFEIRISGTGAQDSAKTRKEIEIPHHWHTQSGVSPDSVNEESKTSQSDKLIRGRIGSQRFKSVENVAKRSKLGRHFWSLPCFFLAWLKTDGEQ